MIPFPLQFGLLGRNRPDFISYYAAGTMVIQTSSTTVAPVVPASARPGTLLIAVVMRRSAVASDPPAGWTLVSSVGPAMDSVATTQYTQVYTKQCVSGDVSASVTFTQASSGRMGGQIFAFAFSSRLPVLVGQSTNLVNNTSTGTITLPSITSSIDSAMALCVGSFIASSTGITLSIDSGWSLISLATVDQNRLAVAIKSLPNATNTSGTITTSGGVTAGNGTTADVLIFAA